MWPGIHFRPNRPSIRTNGPNRLSIRLNRPNRLLMLMLMYKTKLTKLLEYKTKLTESPAYAYTYDFIGTVGTWKCSSACTNDCSTERSGAERSGEILNG